jgi:hypothetical protein
MQPPAAQSASTLNLSNLMPMLLVGGLLVVLVVAAGKR